MKHKKHILHNDEERIGTPVRDEERVYTNYQWRDGQIYSFWTRKTLEPYKGKNSVWYALREDNVAYSRSKHTLQFYSFLQKFIPKNFDKWLDVFGFEQYYCFNPQNPNQVWSKKRYKLIKLAKNNNKQSLHLLFNAVKDEKRHTIYIHQMVWENYYQKKIKKGFVLHHLNHDSFDNRIQNMILLPKKIHSVFEIYYNVYKHKSQFYNKTMTREEFVEKIKQFDISNNDKQKLIETI